MTVLSKSMRAAGMAVVLVCGASIAAPILAAPAAATSPAPQADYPAFRHTADVFRVWDVFYLLMTKAMDSPDFLKDVPPETGKAFVTSFKQRLADRRDVVMDLVMHQAFKSFSHEDVVRLDAIVKSPAGAAIGNAIMRAVASGGDLNMEEALAADPAIKALPEADSDLLGRYFDVLGESLSAADKEIDDISAAAEQDAMAASK